MQAARLWRVSLEGSFSLSGFCTLRVGFYLPESIVFLSTLLFKFRPLSTVIRRHLLVSFVILIVTYFKFRAQPDTPLKK